jgi:predicted dehydrogenase
VHVNDARAMLAAWEKAKGRTPGLIFAMMLQERTLPLNRKLKDIVTGGELGRLLRVTWINTAWFRSQAYYDSGGWRATWAGEGGGILTNQCPHNLDLYQWLFGVPSRVSGFAHLGKYHDIEVEDEVTAYFEHDNGMIGHFVATTAESPGTNRLEIVGEYGNLVSEMGRLVFYRNRASMLEFSKQTKEAFARIECWPTEVPVEPGSSGSHKALTERFVDAILGRGEIVADGGEGIKSVTIANAIMLSSFSGRPVEIPFDADEYERRLQELARSSTYAKKVRDDVGVNMTSSFSH